MITEKQKNKILFLAAQAGIWEQAGLDIFQAIKYFYETPGADAIFYRDTLKNTLLSKKNCIDKIDMFSDKLENGLFNKLKDLAEWQPLFALLFVKLYENKYISIDEKRKCFILDNIKQRKFYNLYKTVPIPKKGKNPLKLRELDELLGLAEGTMKSTSGGVKANETTLNNLKQEFGRILLWLL